MRRFMIMILWITINLPTVSGQDGSPSIPVGLSDPYLMFVPVGWRAESSTPFGFIEVKNEAVTLQVLDPIRLENYLPFVSNSSPRQHLIDYSKFFYVETISQLEIDLLKIGENTVAVHHDTKLPALATYLVELVNGRYALIEAEARDGLYDSAEESVVNAILGTITTSSNEATQSEVLFDTVELPGGNYSLALPPNWNIEPSFVPGQIFLVGDGIEIIVFAPNSLAGYFAFDENVDLNELATVIESELFQLDLTSVELTTAQAGDRRLVAYGFRSLNNLTDTQALLVQLPTGDVGYFKAVAPQEGITQQLQDRIRRIALSLKPSVTDTSVESLFDDDIQANIVPNSGEWAIELRNLMRLVCDGTVEQLIPTTDEIKSLFGDFDTLVADPEGNSLTIASDGIVNLFQRGTLLRDNTPYYQISDSQRGYTITPINKELISGRLNIFVPNENGRDCRIGVNLTLRYID